MSENATEAADVGQDRGSKDFTEKYDKGHGTYRDGVDSPSPETRLPTVSMPKGPDPSPFSIGPLTGGER